MQNNNADRPDDPRDAELETRRLALDEYEHPLYGGADRYARRRDHGTAPPNLRASIEADLDRMRVHELMTPCVASVAPGTPVQEAACTMAERDCGALPVIGENGVLVGMVTDRDIALRLVAQGRDAREAIVADCMTGQVFACYANESVTECMRQMARHQVRRMPIVDDRGHLVGVLAQSDLARHAGSHAQPESRWALTEVLRSISEPATTR